MAKIQKTQPVTETIPDGQYVTMIKNNGSKFKVVTIIVKENQVLNIEESDPATLPIARGKMLTQLHNLLKKLYHE